MASLRKLASRCKFGDFLSEALRDRLVCGLSSEAIQKVLLAEGDLTLETAREIALGQEAATKRTKELKDGQNSSILKVAEPPPGKRCGRCGRGYHNAKCHKCGKVGHIAPVCKSWAGRNHTEQTKWLASADNQEEESLFVVMGRSSSGPYQVELQVNGKPLTMEVDTGAGVSIAAESVLAPMFPAMQLEESNVLLNTYTGPR